MRLLLRVDTVQTNLLFRSLRELSVGIDPVQADFGEKVATPSAHVGNGALVEVRRCFRRERVLDTRRDHRAIRRCAFDVHREFCADNCTVLTELKILELEDAGLVDCDLTMLEARAGRMLVLVDRAQQGGFRHA